MLKQNEAGPCCIEDHLPFWIVEPSGLGIVSASPALAALLDYRPEQLRSIALPDLVCDADLAVLRAAIARPGPDGPEPAITRLRHGSGAWGAFAISWQSVMHEGASAVLGIVRDASGDAALLAARDRLLLRLREQEAKLRMTQQLLDVGIWKIELATGQLVWSESVYRIYGVEPADFICNFESYVALVHPEDRAEMVARYEAFCASDQKVFEFTHRFLRADGTIAHMRGVGDRDDGWLNGVVQDITAEVEAQEKLAEATVMQRIAGRMARLGGWRVDLDPVRLNWSSETCAIHGIPEGTSPNLDEALAFYAPQDRDHIRAKMAACADGGQAFDVVAELVQPDGNRLSVRAIGEPLRDDQGNITAVQGAFQDISELVAARDQTEGLARRLRQTLESISDAFYLLDHDWCFSFMNRKAEALLRRSRDDLLGKNVWDEFPHLVATTFHRQYETAIATGETARFEAHYAPLDAWFEVDAYPTPDGLAVYFIDVTERRKRDEHLRLLEAAVSRQNDVLLITEAEPIDAPDNPKIVYVNDAFVALTGYGRDEVIGKSPRILQGPKTQRAELDRIRRALEKWQPVRAELINYTRSGQEFWLELDIVPLADENGWFTHWVSIERDITDRKRAEEAMNQSEERFRLVAKATNDVVWDWDLRAGTFWWNENLQAAFGYDPAQVDPGPKSWMDHIHPEDKYRVLKSIHAAIDGHANSWTEEYRFLHASGHPLIVVDRAFMIRDAESKAMRMLGSMVDVTKERENEIRLRQSQKLEAVGQLTGGVAHDFNNLLTVILGNAEILSEGLSDQHQLRMLAEMTATAAERGAELTNRLLAFSRKQPLEPRVVDVGTLIQGMEGLLRRTLSENIDIEIVRGAGLWQTEIDPSQLESAVLNMVLNARDAMPDGGQLTIETANSSLDHDYVAREPDLAPGQYVLIVVTDTGDGIPADIISRIFEPFFTTKEIGKGSGLGMSMVYGFVKQSGGHIRVYSEPGEGTSVKLYFPRGKSKDPHVRFMKSGKQIVGGDETILVVEDDTLVRSNLIAQLEAMGYHVVGAASGPEALETLHELPQVDLLFTDIVMPGGMNGRMLADTVRAQRPDMRVLFTSGYTENAIVHHGRLDPGVDLLSKPYRRDQLAAKVRKVLDQRSG